MNKHDTQPDKPLINHRWQLPSLEQMLDDRLPEWPDGKHPDFSGPDGHAKLKNGFRRFGESLLWELTLVLEKAAGRGISEAIAMIQNPDYHKTVKRRRARQTQKEKEYQEQQQRERERRQRGEFTEEERERELARIAYDLKYHQDRIKELKERQLKVETSKPLIGDAEVKQEGDDQWPDTILFD